MGDYDPTDLDGIQHDADLQRRAAKLAIENEDADFVWLMAGPKGRRVVRRLLELTGVFRTSFSANAMQMAQQEGRKQAGYWLLDQIQRLCPDDYHTMMQEASR